jgi:hypothetical protein
MEQLRDKPLCDIVMEGGITSGVIYPKAVVELAKKFRIKNIGGTSAGAIAAATAAAKLGRLHDPSGNPGYTRLAKLTDELSSKNPANTKTTKLHDLFQPQNETRPLFILLSALLITKPKWDSYAVSSGVRCAHFPNIFSTHSYCRLYLR